MGESFGVEFVVEVGSYLGFSGGYMDRKVDGSSVEFYRGLVVLTTLGSNAVAGAGVVSRVSDLRSEVRLYWVVGDSE